MFLREKGDNSGMWLKIVEQIHKLIQIQFLLIFYPLESLPKLLASKFQNIFIFFTGIINK